MGDAGGFLQSIPLHEVRVEKTGTSVTTVQPDGRTTPLRFLHDI